MRTLRTLSGVALALAGVLALALAVTGWAVQRHASATGAFSATLSPVRSSGYAVTVPDVGTLLDRHVVAGMLSSDRVRITVSAASSPIVLWLVPSGALSAYLDGVALTKISAIGFAHGAQPVELTDLPGDNVPPPLVQQEFWTRSPSGQSLEWDRASDVGTSLLLMRADNQPGFAATLTVSIFPTWLDEATWLAAFAGLSLLTGAVALLFWHHQPEPALVLVPEQATEFANLVADRLVADRYGPLPTRMPDRWPDGTATTLGRDLTGELVQVSPAWDTAESPYVHSAT